MKGYTKFVLMTLLFLVTSNTIASQDYAVVLSKTHPALSWGENRYTSIEGDDFEKIKDLKWEYEFDLINREDESEIYVESCNQMITAFESGFEPKYNSEWGVTLDRHLLCMSLDLINNSTNSSISYVIDFAFDIDFPSKVSSELGVSVSKEHNVLRAKATNWNSFSKIDSIEKISGWGVRYIGENSSQIVSLLGKGDYSGNGIEDIFIYVHDSLLEGSYSNSRLFILGKYDDASDFVVLDTFARFKD
ncbi:hypothetical protein [Vibrio sp. WXL103]|uniref:hypothetical protein n=1 Tax=unclassified Vibrio TaxID=2614977 RepID=UPI003EC62A09